MMPFSLHWETIKIENERTLAETLGKANHPLHEAMRYSLLGGGKRLRALLVYSTAGALGTPDPVLTQASAAAVELIHAYSLIHDDLPAMDDDALRRGKPTCHIAFGEAMAILSGDALQTLAFQIIAETRSPHACEAIHILSKHAGYQGMVLGQADDILAEGQTINLEALQTIHRNKTGALILGCIELGMLGTALTPLQHQKLIDYGQTLGLLFQIQDDILDVESNSETLGKATQKDQGLLKATYPSLLGLEEAKVQRDALLSHALACLSEVPLATPFLHNIAEMAATRLY